MPLVVTFFAVRASGKPADSEHTYGHGKIESLSALFETLRGIPLAPRERITFEYVLLRGINDSAEDAVRLASLAGKLPVKVNLILYNEAAAQGYAAPRLAEARAFRDLLLARGMRASIRRRRGADISAACGQLAILDEKTLQHPVPVS